MLKKKFIVISFFAVTADRMSFAKSCIRVTFEGISINSATLLTEIITRVETAATTVKSTPTSLRHTAPLMSILAVDWPEEALCWLNLCRLKPHAFDETTAR
jgi:hypothetical protein